MSTQEVAHDRQSLSELVIKNKGTSSRLLRDRKHPIQAYLLLLSMLSSSGNGIEELELSYEPHNDESNKILQRLFLDKLAYVNMCYEEQNGTLRFVKGLTEKMTANLLTVLSQNFADLSYIVRLAAHKAAVSAIVFAHARSTILQSIAPSDMQTVEPHSEKVLALSLTDTDLYESVKEICTQDEQIALDERLLLCIFVDKDHAHLFGGLLGRLRKHRALVTRVHAELQLLDLFSRRDLACPAGDRYVGMSKGTCNYCCAYMRVHHGGFVVPPTVGGKVVIGVCGPDLDTDREYGGHRAWYKEQVERDVGAELRRDIVDALGRGTNGEHQRSRHLSPNAANYTASLAMLRDE